MKLLNKLLPIATIGSVAAIVTPLATSCGSGTSNFDYTPSIPMHEVKRYGSLAEARSEFFAKVKEKPEIMIQDYYWSTAQRNKQTKAFLEGEYKDVSYSFSVSASFSDIGETTISGQKYYYLSGSSTLKTNISYLDEDTSTGKIVKTRSTTKNSEKYKFEKVVFTLQLDSSDWLITLSIPSGYTEEWKIDSNYETFSKTHTTSDSRDTTEEEKESGHRLYDKDNPISYFSFSFYSYYFQGVTYDN